MTSVLVKLNQTKACTPSNENYDFNTAVLKQYVEIFGQFTNLIFKIQVFF